MAKAEALILWPPDMKSWFIRKDREAGEGKMWCLDSITDSVDTNLSKLRENSEGQGSLVRCMQSMGSQRVGHNLATK